MESGKKVVLASGFLGSGKTTYLLEKARALTENNIKCAIIVNESGEIGVDQIQYVKTGLEVKEIFGGCICCSLTAGLKETVFALSGQYAPEVLLIEPSGVANIKTVIDALTEMGYTRSEISNVMLFDTTRVRMFAEVLEPLTGATVREADQILLTKCEMASDELVQESKAFIEKHRGASMDLLVGGIGAKFKAYAKKVRLTAGSARPAERWRDAAAHFMDAYKSELLKKDGICIGHIKCVLDFSSGYIKASGVAGPAGATIEVCCDEGGVISDTEFIFNSVVHGTDEETEEGVFQAAFNRMLSGFSLNASKAEPSRTLCHGH